MFHCATDGITFEFSNIVHYLDLGSRSLRASITCSFKHNNEDDYALPSQIVFKHRVCGAKLFKERDEEEGLALEKEKSFVFSSACKTPCIQMFSHFGSSFKLAKRRFLARVKRLAQVFLVGIFSLLYYTFFLVCKCLLPIQSRLLICGLVIRGNTYLVFIFGGSKLSI